MKKAVLLINPRSNSGFTEMHVPSTGLSYVAGYLFSKGIAVHGIDAKLENLTPEEVVSRARALAFDVVGITAMTPDVKAANIIARGIKQINPSALIVVGGAHAIAMQEETLLEFDGFDVACVCEGELVIHELVESYGKKGDTKEFDKITGIIYRDRTGRLVRTGERSPIENLDLLPFPKWDLFPSVEEYPVYGERGCPYKCNFCMRALGSRVRKRTPAHVMSEIRWLIQERGVSSFWFDDETFGVDKRWLHELLDLMIEERVGDRLRWSANSRVNLADEEIYKKMRIAGCDRVCYGIESGDDLILKQANKGFTTKAALEAVRKAKNAGLKVGAFYILGHPNESVLQVLRTVNFAAQINADDSSIGIMIPYPGTEIYALALRGEGGYVSVSKDWDRYTKYFGNPMEFKNFSSRTLERIQIMGLLWVYLRNGRYKVIWSEIKRRKYIIKNRLWMLPGLRRIRHIFQNS